MALHQHPAVGPSGWAVAAFTFARSYWYTTSEPEHLPVPATFCECDIDQTAGVQESCDYFLSLDGASVTAVVIACVAVGLSFARRRRRRFSTQGTQTDGISLSMDEQARTEPADGADAARSAPPKKATATPHNVRTLVTEGRTPVQPSRSPALNTSLVNRSR